MTTDDRIRDAVNAYVTRARAEMETHAQALAADLTQAVSAERAELQGEVNRLVAEAREDEARLAKRMQGDALAAADQLLERRVAEVREEETRIAKQVQDQALAAVRRARESRLDDLERLMMALRRIDESNSLTAVLSALARGAAVETSRVAILLVDGDIFRTWEHLGFDDGTGPTEIPMDTAGALASAVSLKQTSLVTSVPDDDESSLPDFMRVPDGHTALAVPLLVGGDVVAVLYADDVSKTVEGDGVALWTEEVQLLARHAALRLENVTSVRAVEVLAGTD